MTATIVCPNPACGKPCPAAESGHAVRCPHCGETFSAPAASAGPTSDPYTVAAGVAPPAAGEAAAILLGYLQCRAGRLGPGGDGVTLDAVRRSYPQAAAARLVPDLPELLRRYPDLADELTAWCTERAADAARSDR
jgi:hypothetical protein